MTKGGLLVPTTASQGMQTKAHSPALVWTKLAMMVEMMQTSSQIWGGQGRRLTRLGRRPEEGQGHVGVAVLGTGTGG